MVSFFGDYDLTETVRIPFNTFSSDDPSASVTITNLVAGDIEIHKDGSITQRASDAGVTVTIDFDSITGNHMAHIDLSDDTDAGYYSAGSRYQVRVEGTTVDGATINAWIGAFSIGCTLRPTTAGRKLDVTATGGAGIDWANVENPTTAVDLSATAIDLCDEVTVNSDMRGTDSAALASVCTEARLAALTDWINGGRLDLILDIIAADVVNIDGAAMRGTDSAALAASWTATRAGYVDALNGHIAQTGDSFVRIGATGSGLTSLAQASVLGALADAAAADDPTTADTIMQYVKQLVNILVGTAGVATFPAEAAPGNAVSLAEVVRAIHADVTGLNGSAMRGTDSAALASAWTATRAGYVDELAAANLPTDIAAIPTTAMRGTDNAALASVCTEGRLAELDAANLPTDVAAIPTTAMRGTDSAALASAWTATRAGYIDELAAANIPADLDAVKAKTDNLPGSVARAVQLAGLTFMMVDATDGYTAETSATVTAQISKDGGALATCTNSVTEIGNGLYKITLTATEMTATVVTLRFTATGCRTTVMTLLTDT